MSRIAVVGGHGKIARQLHPLLVEAGHTPVALVRSEDHRSELESAGAEVRLLDIENSHADAFAEAFTGCDAVVFSAGAGADGKVDRKRTVDLEGSLKSIAAATTSGIRRFVQVSAIGVDRELDESTEEVWRAYVEAKRGADQALRDSDLEWTILRPGRLTDDPGTGFVRLAQEVDRGDVTRADVAAMIVAVLEDERAVRQQWELVGGSTPVRDAVAEAVGDSDERPEEGDPQRD